MRPSGRKRQKPLLRVLSRNRRPRDKAEALAWLKQLARDLRDIQKEQLKAFRPVAETARHAVLIWTAPWIASLRP